VPGPVVFCIGLNRTGTTTFGDACRILGFTRLGWVKTPARFDSHFLLKAWERGDMEHLASVASEYQVLEDLPWPLVYPAMSEAFPDAKFALTRRTSVDVWLESQAKHTRGSYGMHRKIYGSSNAAEDPDLYRATYERHLREVREFFTGSDRFVELCWEDGDGWKELCAFLDVPVPDQPFPHSNPAGWKPPPPPPPPSMVKRAVLKVRRMATPAKDAGPPGASVKRSPGQG
jgi:hypothetical protein